MTDRLFFILMFFVYGLTFFLLGITILVYPRRVSHFKLAQDLKLIAFFGILHGLNEWFDMLNAIQGFEPPSLKIAKLVLLASSFYFLISFGIKAIAEKKGGGLFLKAIPLVLLAFWAIISFTGNMLLYGDIFARYLLGLPGTLLTAYGFILHIPEVRNTKAGTLNFLKSTAGVFIIYGFLAGLVVPQADFFPASVLNYRVFFENFGVHVQYLRALCAIALFFTTTQILKVFEWETVNSLKEAHDRLEEKVRERTAELELANKELESFSYSVSHDLRAPLRHLAGFVELLNKRTREGLDEKSRHYLEVISSASSQMGKLIDELLAFSRAGRVEIKWEKVNSDALVKEAISSLMAEVKGRDIQWKIGELPSVSGDPTLLRQVWINLISNAVKFTRPRERAVIEITATQEGADLVFRIKDNGVGFDMKYKDKLFGIFQRLHSPEEFEGTGIGLANVQRVIHRHGGRVWAESVLGEGASFYFSLPKRR